MPYLPPTLLHATEFPSEFGKDVHAQIRAIEEKWRRFYPEINYYSLNVSVTNLPATTSGDVDTESVSGLDDGSVFDLLMGEAVDNTAKDEGWKQPHLSGDRRAVNPEKYRSPDRVHAQVRREAKEKELKKLGFDEVRDLIVTIPCSMLDRLAIEVRIGDRFIWDNELFEVEQFEKTGYWKNTNLRFYVVMNCRHARIGS